jgi:hypothetical protein
VARKPVNWGSVRGVGGVALQETVHPWGAVFALVGGTEAWAPSSDLLAVVGEAVEDLAAVLCRMSPLAWRGVGDEAQL